MTRSWMVWLENMPEQYSHKSFFLGRISREIKIILIGILSKRIQRRKQARFFPRPPAVHQIDNVHIDLWQFLRNGIAISADLAIIYWNRFSHLLALCDWRKTLDPKFGAEILPWLQSSIVRAVLTIKLHPDVFVPVAFVIFGAILPLSVSCQTGEILTKTGGRLRNEAREGAEEGADMSRRTGGWFLGHGCSCCLMEVRLREFSDNCRTEAFGKKDEKCDAVGLSSN